MELPIFFLTVIIVSLIIVSSMIQTVTSAANLKLVSDPLKSQRAVEGANVVFNCTISGRENPKDRITWHIDWTPEDALQGREFSAEQNKTLTDSDIHNTHGKYSFEYVVIDTGMDVTDIHMCLLRISGVTFADAGDYLCSYYSFDTGDQTVVGGKATLFVMPNNNIVLPTTKRSFSPSTVPPGGHPTTFPPGGVNNSQGGGSTATTASIIVVLILIIVILVSAWAIFRYRRYKKDKQTDVPTELPKIEPASTTTNSYRDVTHTGSAHNARNIVITDDVAGVRLPPSFESGIGEPPSYSSLNRPDSTIRDHLGYPTYQYPDDTNQDYVITTIGPEQPSLPAKSNLSNERHTDSSEKPPLPSRTSSASQSGVKMTPSDTPGYEIVEPNFTPRKPNDSVYLSPATLAYQKEDEGSYEAGYEAVNPET